LYRSEIDLSADFSWKIIQRISGFYGSPSLNFQQRISPAAELPV